MITIRYFASLTKYTSLLGKFDFPELPPRVVTHENMKLSQDFDVETITSGLSQPIYDMMDRGGKQWRAALCLITASLFNQDLAEIVPLAKAIEIIHAGSLICDDIEDCSEKRRGKLCTYKIFGLDRALNAGNFMYFWPLKMIMNSEISDKVKQEIMIDYAEEIMNIHLGQCTDIEWNRSDVIPTEVQYLRMVSNKTSVLARLAVKFSLRICAADAKISSALVKHAENIGISFQVWDDIINLESEEYTKGRSYLGEDITEGKKTLIVIKALENLPQSGERLRNILKLKTKDQSLINEALQIIRESKSIEYCKVFSEDLIKASWKEIEQELPESEAKEDLFYLSFRLINRKS